MIFLLKKNWQYIYLYLLLYFFYNYSLKAANENYIAGAEAAGLSGATVSLKDHWSAFYNQAGLAELQIVRFGIYTENRFNIKELSSGAFALAVPAENIGVFALSFYHFGFKNYYNQNKIALAYAKQLSPVISAAIQLDVFKTVVTGTDNRFILTGETGMIIQLNEKISLGTHIFNPTVRLFDADFDERMPSVMKMGGSYKFSKKLFLALEIENDLNYNANFKGGIEYKLNENLSVLTGIATHPLSNSFGVKLKYEYLRINIAFSFHQNLGISPHVSLDYMGR